MIPTTEEMYDKLWLSIATKAINWCDKAKTNRGHTLRVSVTFPMCFLWLIILGIPAIFLSINDVIKRWKPSGGK